MTGDPTPIPPFAEEALGVLAESIDGSCGLDEQAAVRRLEAAEFTTADAKEALEILEMRGYLYRVEDELRITD